MLEINKIYNEDCLEGMKRLDNHSVDMILSDLPYGVAAYDFNKKVSLEPLWQQYKRLIKDDGAIVLTATQPFTSELVLSNIGWFKCEWIWVKNRGSNFSLTKFQPMKEHESILVFGKGKVKYGPIKEERKGTGSIRVKSPVNINTQTTCYWNSLHKKLTLQPEELRFPSSVQKFNLEVGIHPSQKPVKLFEYFIMTYSNVGDLVLDSCIGSGTTAIACINLKRNFIGFDNGVCTKKGDNLGRYWAEIATERIKGHIEKEIASSK